MDTISSNLQGNLAAVRARIAHAAAACGRDPGGIALIAVSKTFGAADIAAAHDLGLAAFGENYLQEALPKMDALAELRLEWHFIGPLQSNKTARVAERFDWVHSVDRLKTAQRLSAARPAACPPLNVLVQVNMEGEATKGGVAPSKAPPLAQAIAALPGLRLRGLMAIPQPRDDAAGQRRVYAAVRALRDDIQAGLAGGAALDTLSMGMSSDLEAAIAGGATMIRVGTALFGTRRGING